MTAPAPKKPDTTDQQTAPAGQEGRSDNLLPADADEDGRYDVAEEVNMDQQSDTARRVGQAPEGIGAEALGASLSDEGAAAKD